MNIQKKVGPWLVEYRPKDGGRIGCLKYGDIDLLTVEPNNFIPPKEDYGEYELRPVYGYDDCFPSVESCYYPGSKWMIPDHGEVCWLPFKVKGEKNSLRFEVDSKNIPARLVREMIFEENKLIWSFRVENLGNKEINFQHVIHPLMPINSITGIKLPGYESVFDDINNGVLSLDGSHSLEEFLLSRPSGSTNMLFIRNIKMGEMSWDYVNKIRVVAKFSPDIFPSIGIWWNNGKYPDEDNCRRNECALEPVPGLNSRLSDAIECGKALKLSGGDVFEWEIEWNVIAI